MIKFSVNLTKYDLKQFIKHSVRKRSLKFLTTPIIYFCAAVFMIIVNLFLSVGMVVWLAAVILILMSISIVHKTVVTFKKLFVQSLDLIGKNREFFVDDRGLEILCDNNLLFCGRYFFYDLQTYEQNSDYFFLAFSKNIYIIVPKRSLNDDQEKNLKFILDRAVKN